MLKQIILIFCLLTSSTAFAENASDQTIRNFLNKIQNLMNKKDIKEIETFYSYFTDSGARFIKKSYLLDNTDKSKILAEESLNMSKEEYINYIKEILKPLNQYAYRINIQTIDRNDAAGIAIVNYSVDEYTLIKSEQGSEEAAFISANCNMNVGLETGDAVILSTNCIEKIVKKTN